MEPKGTAVVTGASRGIGRAVAIELAARGFDTIATMRDPAAGNDLDGIEVQRLDVTDPSSISLPEGLRVLVNNAGVESHNLPLEHMPLEQWERMFATNVFGLVAVTQRAVPLMRAAGGGVICNVTSSSTLAPVPFLGTYRASKAAVTAIGESLAAEVAQFGIRVVEIMPGPIETDMLAASDRPPAGADFAEYRDLAGRMWEGRQGIRNAYTPAAEAARRIVDAICADNGPLRYGCDDMSEGMLAGWNDTNNAQWVGGMLKSFRVITGLAHTALHVDDVDAAVAWYRDVLGLVVLSPPYLMEGEEITRDMSALLPEPVVVKAAIVGVDDRSDRVIEVIEYPSVTTAPPEDAVVTRLGYTHVALLCDDVAATRSELEAKGVTFLVEGIADVAGVRTTWIADPWNNVFILVEKVRRPDRPYYRQY